MLEDDRYKKFMNAFGADVSVSLLFKPGLLICAVILNLEGMQHIVASREHGADPVTFTSAAFNQLRLAQLNPSMFRVPKFHLADRRPLECERNSIDGKSDPYFFISVLSDT